MTYVSNFYVDSSVANTRLFNYSATERGLCNRFKIMHYFQTLPRRNSYLTLDNETINELVSSRTKCHRLCFKIPKNSGPYLLLFESNK